MKTVRLLFWSAVAYAVLLVLIRGVFPAESAPTISLTGIPLIVMVILITRDLAGRSKSPSVERTLPTNSNLRGDPVQFLSGQVRVAARASDSYFENVARTRLKELLVTKVSIETGLENETVRRILIDPGQGPRLLGDDSLYRMLYGPVPRSGVARIEMIDKTLDLIGVWKG